MGMCCSQVEDREIEVALSPIVESLPDALPLEIKPEPAKWDGGRPRLPLTIKDEPATPSLLIDISSHPGSPTAGIDPSRAKRPQADPTVVHWFRKLPLVTKLSPDEIQDVIASTTQRTFRPNYKIFVEGDVGYECFILAKGTARVTKWSNELKNEVEQGTLSVGDFFGEGALLNEGLSIRGATITALSPCTCYLVDRDKFRNFLGKDRLQTQFTKRAAISDNLASQQPLPTPNSGPPGLNRVIAPAASSPSSAPPNAVRTKTPATATMLLNTVMESVLFANIDESQRKGIVDVMWLRNVNAGEVIIQQGDFGEHWYVVDSGSFDILLNAKNGGQNKVAVKERGAGVGELALLYNAPRAATVKASRPSSVWVLDRYTYRSILQQAAEDKRQKYETFLRSVKAFDVLLDSERTKLVEALEEVTFEENTPFVIEGEMGDTFYLIQSGIVSVTKKEQGELVRLKAGDYVGERSILKNEPRAATCTAVTKVVCLFLKRDAFKDLLGNMNETFKSRQEMYSHILDEKMKQKMTPAAAKEAAAQAFADEIAGHKYTGRKAAPSLDGSTMMLQHLKLTDLKVLGTLGKGSFGTVQLVRDRTGATYALKIVAKQSVVDQGQQEHTMNEKRTMVQLNHPFLVRLFATFKDADRLYFLLEASLGGELFTALRKSSTFTEPVARFYAAGVVLAFEYMHAKGIIYRDLKPENLLLDSKGYLKVTDFGFAKKIGEGRTWTLCGTPDYLAPEVVSGQGHGKAVDWWTLGILIFEMLAGYPPFYDEDPMKTYGRILSGQINFPMHFSKQATDLIKKLLNPKAGKRYGSLAGGASLIKNHPWFARFDWHAFLARRLPAPMIPLVKSPEDMSNFDRSQDQQVKVIPYRPKPGTPDWCKDF